MSPTYRDLARTNPRKKERRNRPDKRIPLVPVESFAADTSSASDTVCRYGGDEFVVLLTEISKQAQVAATLKKVRTALAPHFVIGDYQIRLTVSDGLAIYPSDAQCLSGVLRLSDRSMLTAKCMNRGGTVIVAQPDISLRNGVSSSPEIEGEPGHSGLRSAR